MRHNIDGQFYDVIVERKNNKNTYIRIKKEQKIHVTTNFLTTDKQVIKLIENNESSIKKMLNKTVKEQNSPARFCYLGQVYDIIVMPTIDEVKIMDTTICIPSDLHLSNWQKEQTTSILSSRYDYVHNLFKEDIPYYNLKIRKMRSRWGVCNKSSKSITLNAQLIHFPVEVIDYVVIHEMAHLIHFNHSKSFWLLVSKYCPEYKQARKVLKSRGIV